jgi:hypothetical protein
VADSEVRQKFETWAAEHMKDGPTWAKWIACDAFAAGMRAGEIARWIPVEEKGVPTTFGEYLVIQEGWPCGPTWNLFLRILRRREV